MPANRRVKQRRRSLPAVAAAVLLLTGAALSTSRDAAAQAGNYVFTLLATLGTAEFASDFEPWSINNRGQVAFGADLPNGGGEALYVADHGQITQIAKTGQAAPGGGTFSFAFLGQPALNDQGNVAFTFTLAPFSLPIGFNAGVYYYLSHNKGTLSTVIVPGVTPAPGGGTFAGATFRASLNNAGDLTFTGIVPANIGPGAPVGLGQGIFRVDRFGAISSVVRPGDAAPGGGTFDFAQNPWINDGGDIAFGGHVAGEECIDEGVTLPAFIFCAESVYLKSAPNGAIQSIAHQGDPAPGGGVFRDAFGPAVNNRGQVAFIGDLTPAPDAAVALGVFLYTRGTIAPVARPGDAMPGGGHMLTASNNVLDFHLNDTGKVAFGVFLDTDVNGDGIPDTGIYVGTPGSLRLVARTGTVLPGIGTIAQASASFGAPPVLGSGAANNNHGQVFFNATLTDGSVVLLLATPR
jgi:hypothetical protein